MQDTSDAGRCPGDLHQLSQRTLPHVPGAYGKTSVAQPVFLPWKLFYATLRAFLCCPSDRMYLLSWGDVTRAKTVHSMFSQIVMANIRSVSRNDRSLLVVFLSYSPKGKHVP